MTDNQVQYIIDVKNRFSDKLERISRDVAAFNSRMDATGQRLQKRFDDYGNRIGALPGKIERLQERLTGLQGRLTKAFDEKHIAGYNRMIQSTQRELEKLGKIGLQTGNKLPKGAGGGLGFLGKLGAGGLLPSLGIAMGVGALAGGVKEIFATTAKYEQLNTGFQVLLGSKAKGDAMVGQLMQYAAKSPLRNEDVMPAAQTLLGFGVSAEKILPSIRMLGDVSMGNKEKFQGLALAFAQSSAAGRLMGQDLLQMVSNGFNPLQEISEMTGRSIGQLKKDMEGGKISSDMVTKAFEHATAAGGRFYDMANKQSETLGGRLSTVQDNIDQMNNAVGQRLYPAFSDVLGVVSALVGKVTEWFSVSVEEKLQDQATKINILHSELTNANTSSERRKQILMELRDINPEIVKGIDAESINYKLLAENIDKVTVSLAQQIAVEKISKKYKNQLDEWKDVTADLTGVQMAIQDVLLNVDKGIANRTDLTIRQKVELAKRALRNNPDWNQKGNVIGTAADGTQIYDRSSSQKNYSTLDQLSEKHGKLSMSQSKEKSIANEIEVQKQLMLKSFGMVDGASTASNSSAKNVNNKGASLVTGGASGNSTFDPSGAIDSVASGGSKSTNITVNFGKLVEQFIVHATGIKEGFDEIENKGTEALLRVLNGANKLATKQ